MSGVISGTVVDASGGSVPDARVTLTNEDTSVRRIGSSEQNGGFSFPGVLPGRYAVTAEKEGFKRFEKRDLNVTADERLPAGEFVLQVGQVTEVVTVQASGTPVQTGSSERSGLLTPAQMGTLMSRGRDFLSLLRVLPGVVPTTDADTIGQRVATPNIQGMRSTYSNITIDGVSSTDLGSMQVNTAPTNMDAIGEVKVLMNNYQAEYGRLAGTAIIATTKSGAAQFHGDGYYYKRNEEFNANDFFNNRNGRPIARYRYNTWGYNFGGPVLIPKLVPRSDKLFFFFSQEILPTNTPQTIQNVTVPTAAERAGDFSHSPVKPTDPLAGGALFGGNMIPLTRIDPNGQKLLSIFPLPNQLNTAITKGGYNYTFQESIPASRFNEVYRTDYNLTEKLRMYIRGEDFRVHQSGFNIAGGASAAAWGALATSNRQTDDSGVFNLIYTPAASIVNEFSFGVHHPTQDTEPLSQAALNNVSKAGLELPCRSCAPHAILTISSRGSRLAASPMRQTTQPMLASLPEAQIPCSMSRTI